jgi:protein-S-isoprenylcysteine O-methyltransferase Ste14
VWAILLYVFLVVWFVLEDVLIALGRKRGTPAPRADRTTLVLAATVPLAMVAAGVLAATAAGVSGLRMPGYPWIGVAGLVAVVVGLGVRTWWAAAPRSASRAITLPGSVGFILAGIGCGLLSTTWLGLVLLVVAPLLANWQHLQVADRRLAHT